jgi:hypothetical protein
MTNINKGDAKAILSDLVKDALKAVKEELAAALGRIKSLEDTAVIRETRIGVLEKSNGVLEQKIVSAGTSEETGVLWSRMVKDNAVTNGISKLVMVEKNQVHKKMNNLLIMERHDNQPKKISNGTDTELVKGEVRKVLTAIGKENVLEKVRSIRFKADGPILMVFENLAQRLEVLKASNKLKENNYVGVYINTDRTAAEAANEKILKVEMKELNSNLTDGDGSLKFGKKSIGGEEFKWYWGIRNGELRKIYKKLA